MASFAGSFGFVISSGGTLSGTVPTIHGVAAFAVKQTNALLNAMHRRNDVTLLLRLKTRRAPLICPGHASVAQSLWIANELMGERLINPDTNTKAGFHAESVGMHPKRKPRTP